MISKVKNVVESTLAKVNVKVKNDSLYDRFEKKPALAADKEVLELQKTLETSKAMFK